MRPMLVFFLSALAATTLLAEPLGITVSGSNVQTLVSVSWENSSGAYLPGYTYHSSFGVFWAIPNSALMGIDSDRVDVYVHAYAPDNSTILFLDSPTPKETSFVLTCFVQAGSCGSNSTLNKKVDFTLVAFEGQQATSELIAINASLSQPQQPALEPQNILRTLAQATSNYSSLFSNSSALQTGSQAQLGNLSEYANISNLLPTKGAAQQQSASFLLQNPLVSLAAFALVAIVTGAYLLKNRD